MYPPHAEKITQEDITHHTQRRSHRKISPATRREDHVENVPTTRREDHTGRYHHIQKIKIVQQDEAKKVDCYQNLKDL